MINLSAVRADLKAALSVIANLNVYDWNADHIEPPAAVVLLPDRVVYRSTYGTSGVMTFADVQVLLLIRRADMRAGVEAFDPYVARTGAASIFAALEGYASYGALQDVTVTEADFASPTVAGVEYLGCLFHLDVLG